MELTTTLSGIERAQLIRRLDEDELAYLFKHTLVQETVYAGLLKQERRHLHARVAASLERAFAQQTDALAATLAEHYWQSEVWSQAAEYSIRAGTRALGVYALREALAHFERALAALEHTAPPSPLQMYDALMGWAEAAAKFRPYAEQLEQLARAENIARELGDKPRLARALYSIGGVHIAQGHSVRAGEPLAECFTLANELGDERLTLIPTYFMGMGLLDTNPRAASALFERALELARRYENQDMEAIVSTAQAWALARRGEFEQAQDAIARGQQLLPRVKSPMTASDVDLFSGWSFFDMGDAQQGLRYGQRGVEKARAAENLDCICGAYLCVGFNQLSAQQLVPAQEAFREAIRESQFSGAVMFENLGRAGLALAEIYSGRDEALGDLEHALTRSRELEDQMGSALLAQALGEIYARRGDAARAESLLNDALDFFRRAQMAPYVTRTLETLRGLFSKQGRTAEANILEAEAMQNAPN